MLLQRQSGSGVIKLEIFPELAFSILALLSFEILSQKSFYPVKKKILS
jgi:hypothetical protein